MKQAAILLIALIALSGCTQLQDRDTAGQETAGQEQIFFSVKVFDKDGELRAQKGLTATKGQSVFEALGKGNVQMDYENYQFGVFLKGIEGVYPAQNEYIAVYVDGKYAEKGISEIRAEEGMLVEFKPEEIKAG